jgi:hypothetical protein
VVVGGNVGGSLLLPNQSGICGRLQVMPYHVAVKLMIIQLKMPDINAIPLLLHIAAGCSWFYLVFG